MPSALKKNDEGVFRVRLPQHCWILPSQFHEIDQQQDQTPEQQSYG